MSQLSRDIAEAQESMSDIGRKPASKVPARPAPPLPKVKPDPEDILGEPRVGQEPMTHDVHVGDTVHMPKGDCFEVQDQDEKK